MSRTRSTKLRRTWPQRLLISFNVTCIVAALFTAGTLAYAKHKVGQITKVDIGENSGFKGTEGLKNTDPRNFLIVGADTDDGLDASDPVRRGRDKSVVGVRSDTIMVVRLDPKTTQAQILSFPRDLWVPIPGKSDNRINAALQFGGPDLLIQTIKQDFDIDINHYVQVNFAGFKRLVRTIGGVPIWFDTPVGDGSSAERASSGLNIQYPGCTLLDETGSLQYVRSRHLFRVINGRRVYDGTSDLGRISRQQDFIRRVLRRAIAQGARNPLKLSTFVDIGVTNITLDRGTTAKDLVALGSAFRDFDPNQLKSYSLPVVGTTRGGAAVLDLQESAADPILAIFRGTGATTVTGSPVPAAISVQVLNGSGKQNQAADTTAALRAIGFQMQSPDQTLQVARTEVRYPPGQEHQAALVARYLFANPVLVLDRDATAVTVVTGPDFAAVLKDPRPASAIPVPTTTTTSTTSTTSTTLPAGVTTTTTSSGGGSSSTSSTPSTTTTTVAGWVPGPAPAGVDCG